MGNTCQTDEPNQKQSNIILPGSRLRQIVPVKNMPKSSYAYQVIKPNLNQNVLNTLTDINITKSLKRDSQKQVPYFYIVSKKTYYQGGFNQQRFPHGKGIAIFQDGTYYEGQFINGQAQDNNGLIIFPNGGYYQGNIHQSTMNGKGRFYHKGVYQYQGEWQAGYPSGNGQETYIQNNKQKNQSKERIKYKGNFKSGIKQGSGQYSWQGGKSKYVGKFQKGLMNDNKGSIQTTTSKFTGNFISGKRQGYGSIKTSEGTLEGQFKNDQINGPGKFQWKDKKVYQGNFEKSQFHGPGKIIYPNKSIVQGQWRQNHNFKVSKIAFAN